MQSSNPVFARSAEFNGRANANGNPTYPGNGQGYAGYGSPSQWSVGTPGQPGTPNAPQTHMGAGTGPMTIDSVVQKTGATMVVMLIAAAATWVLTGDINSTGAMRSFGTLAIVGAGGGFALAMVNSFKKVISPALVLAYAAFEGVFIGAMSKVFEVQWPGIVMSAVLGTFAAVAGTLAAYKFFDIQVGDKFRKWVTAAMFGFIAVVILDVVLSIFHASLGVNGFGPLGFIFSVIGLGLGVLMLIMDFDYIERGVAAGIPERESWRAAFGLTVTIIWIYIEILRILAIFRGN